MAFTRRFRRGRTKTSESGGGLVVFMLGGACLLAAQFFFVSGSPKKDSAQPGTTEPQGAAAAGPNKTSSETPTKSEWDPARAAPQPERVRRLAEGLLNERLTALAEGGSAPSEDEKQRLAKTLAALAETLEPKLWRLSEIALKKGLTISELGLAKSEAIKRVLDGLDPAELDDPRLRELLKATR